MSDLSLLRPEDFTRIILPKLVFVQREGVEGLCWEWTASLCGGRRRTREGEEVGRYPQFVIRIEGRKRKFYAHRAVCYWWHGPPPTPDAHCDHRHGCRLGRCVNPKFLRWVSPETNCRLAGHAAAGRGDDLVEEAWGL